MTFFARLLTVPLLAVPLLALAISGATVTSADARQSARGPTVTGAYLAGTHAMQDLRTADAARHFRAALAADPDNPQLIERSFIAFAANGDMEEAARTARRLLEYAPNNELARLVIAAVDFRQLRYSAAVEELSQMRGESFAGITGKILEAWALVAQGERAEADAVLDNVADGGLEDFLVFHRALMAELVGDHADALTLAARAHEVDPLVARIVEAYARFLGNAGRFDEASEVLATFDREGFSHPLVDAIRHPISERIRPGPFLTSVHAGAAEVFHGIGVAIARDGNSDIATLFLRIGLYLEPRADIIALVLGQLLDQADEHLAANELYAGIDDLSPMKPTAVVRMAQNYDSMGNRAEAIERLAEIVRANPDDLDAISALGDLQRADERYLEAAETYTRALELTGGDRASDWRLYYVRGIAYERAKVWPKAEEDFKRALEFRPDQPQVLNYLGYSWVDQGMNLEEALEMIERAVAAAPNDGYIVDSLGWAFYRLGRYEEAVEALERAVRLRPNDPEINDHLGDAYWQVGRRLEARFQWNIATYMDDSRPLKHEPSPLVETVTVARTEGSAGEPEATDTP